jgi:diguanylate cyclase (GGDEF)-like protein
MTVHADEVDAHTGLANRRSFERRLAEELESKRPVGLILLDIVDTKELNDAYGYVFVDELLKAIGARLAGVFHEDDVVARVGGDEFAVVADCVGGDQDELELLTQELLDSLSEPFDVANEQIRVGVRFGSGIVESPEDFARIDRMMLGDKLEDE